MAEAAAILDTTPKAVESRLYRARKILREQLQGWV
jgi:DNA-directed RNA polymerase specialized sigma24 family protein